MSGTNWTDEAWGWFSETIIDNAVSGANIVVSELAGGVNSFGAAFAAPIGYYIDKAADAIAGRDIKLDDNDIARGIYNQYNQSWVRHLNENPGQVAADITQGTVSAVTGTVGLAGDAVWYIGGDLILHPAYATAHNLYNDENNQINYMTDKPFGSYMKQLNDWGQINHWLPDNWKDAKDVFSRIDPSDHDAHHRRISLYGAMAAAEVVIFPVVAIPMLGAGASGLSILKKSLGAKTMLQLKNAGLLDDVVENAEKLAQAQEKLKILKEGGEASATKISKAWSDIEQAQKTLSNATLKAREKIDLGYVNKNELAGDAAKASDEIEALIESGASAKKIKAAQKELTAIETKVEALSGVRAVQGAAEVGAKLPLDAPNFVQRMENAKDLGLYKGTQWLDPRHSKGAETIGVGISYVLNVREDLENSEITLKTNDGRIDTAKKAQRESIASPKTPHYNEDGSLIVPLSSKFKENNGSSSGESNDGALSTYSGTGINQTALEFNLLVNGGKTKLDKPVITVMLSEKDALDLKDSLVV